MSLSLDDMLTKPDDEYSLKDIVRCIIGLRDDITNRLSSIEQKIADIPTLKAEVETLKFEMEETKQVVADLNAAGDPFPANLSVLVSNLPAQENEDSDTLLQDVQALFTDGLELPNVSIQAVHRIPPRSYAAATAGRGDENQDDSTRPGLVKVRVKTLEDKKSCLRNKMKLRQNTDYRGVYLRNCEDHASRLNRLNMETLLDELKLQDEYTLTGSGRLVRKQATDQQGGAGPENRRAGPTLRQRAPGPQQGAPTRGRGGRGRRGGH